MLKGKRLIIKLLLVMMLAFSVAVVTDTVYPVTAQAAVTAPIVKEAKKTLYSDYDSYNIVIKNVAKNSVIVYKSNNPKIASVTAKGVVKPLSAGKTTVAVTVKQNSKTYRFKVTIEVKNPSLTITKKTDTMYNNETFQFEASEEGMNASVAWSVSNQSVADIDSNGIFTAKAAGSVIVYAKADGKTSKCDVKIEKKELSSKEIYAKCISSTVEIETVNKYGGSLGSGFFIGDGKIVTNYHVIRGASKITVRTYDKKEYEATKILGYDEDIDLAVLQLDADYIPLSICETAAGGEEIYTLGSPLGLTGTMTKGMISTASRVIDKVDYIQIDASISRGNSGGPLVNVYGEVIGVNTMYYQDGQNLNFAINIKELNNIATNSPISVADYYNKYLKEHFMYEDPSKSQTDATCQEVLPGIGVIGTIQASENGDCYYFRVTEKCTFYGYIFSENQQDEKNTYFVLYTYNGERIDICKEYDDLLYQDIEHDLEPGNYIIFVCGPDNYTGSDINYVFNIFYK